jgi:uncharacterized protein (TIGR03118 family)
MLHLRAVTIAGHRRLARSWRGRARLVLAAAVAAALAAVPLAQAQAHGDHRDKGYQVTNLVSDQPGVAPLTDPDLVNAWGVALGPPSSPTPLWVSDNGTDKATIYPGSVAGSPLTKAGLVVSVPGAPTGQVFNGGPGFVVSNGTASGPALFIFDTESGQILGWNAGVPPPAPSTQAQVAATVPDAIYKGLAIASNDSGTFLFAANFHAATIDVFDDTFTQVHWKGAFVDRHLPRGFAPFNVQTLGDRIYVAYAKQDADAEDEVAGRGLGFVDVFTTKGRLLRRLVSRGALNAPWGLAIAPDDFGRFSHALLVGNFGDGTIHAYSPRSGRFLGTLRDARHKPIVIDGLWALQFGNGRTGDLNALLFTAGPDDETHGLLGRIDAIDPD